MGHRVFFPTQLEDCDPHQRDNIFTPQNFDNMCSEPTVTQPTFGAAGAPAQLPPRSGLLVQVPHKSPAAAVTTLVRHAYPKECAFQLQQAAVLSTPERCWYQDCLSLSAGDRGCVVEPLERD